MQISPKLRIRAKMDFHKICRTCLGEIGNPKSLFNLHYINEEHLKLSEILTACTSIEVLENDNLPKQVCIQCENNILNTFKFQEQCHKSNSVLRAIVSNSVQCQLAQLNTLNNTGEISLQASMPQSIILGFEQKEVDRLDSGVENPNSLLDKPIKIELNTEEMLKDDNDCLVNIGKNVENVCENFSKAGYIDSTIYSFKEERDENNLSSSYHTDSVHSQHIGLRPSQHTFKQNQVNNSDETINGQLTSVKILKEDSDEDEENFGDEGDVEFISYSFNENYGDDLSSNYDDGSQQTEPNDIPEEVEDETLQPLFPCEAKGCTACFTEPEDLKVHRKGHPPEFCKICHRNFAAGTLSRHMTRKHKPKKITHLCSGCGKKYRSLSNHTRNIHIGPEEPFKCKKCSNGTPKEVGDETLQPLFPCEAKGCTSCFTTLKDLKKHSKKHAPRYCKICDKRFVGGTLSQHMAKKHRLEKITHLCSDCGNEYTSLSNLKKNIHIFTEGVFSCEKCGKTFAYLFRLLEHMKMHSNLKNFICPECGETIADYTSFLVHIKAHNKIKAHKCPECVKRLCGPGSIAAHLTDHETADSGKPHWNTPHLCETCGKMFSNRFKLKGHIRIHSGRPYLCTYCGKRCVTKTHLTTHTRIHTGEKPYKCNVCSQSFGLGDSLKRHIIKVHTGKREHVCGICHKAFIQKYSLKAHMLTHTGERKYVCDICHKRFAEKGKLESHMIVHTGERKLRNYICNICNRRFIQKSVLKVHMRLHTGEKPYKCNVCNKSFAHYSNYYVHKKSHKQS